MRKIQLLDIKIDVPEDVTVDERRPGGALLFFGLTGDSVPRVREEAERSGQALGFEIVRKPNGVHLLRRTQRINMVAFEPNRLDITVDDPEVLPRAHVEGGAIVLGTLSVPIKTSRLVPGRERSDPELGSWSAEWYAYGRKPEELAAEIDLALRDQGLHSNGVWQPPKGGIERWSVEAHSAARLVKVYVTPKDAHVELSITLIDAPMR